MSGALDFLAAVTPPLVHDEYLEVRGVHALTGARRAWCRSLVQTARTAIAWSESGMQTWVGINPRGGKRSGDAACTRTVALPADLDAKLTDGDMRALQSMVDDFPLPPSAVVGSGSGLHIYWCLGAPVDLRVDGMARRVRSCADRLARALAGPERHPDLVGNAERLLRLPGTANHKYAPPRPVRLLRCEAMRYSLENLEEWLTLHAPWTAPPPILPPAPRREPLDGVIADVNATMDALALLARYGASVVSRHAGITYLCRPGKAGEVSASYNYYPDALHVFTTNWPPFEAGHTYDGFALYALLEHGGARDVAYYAAKRAGYGTRFGMAVDARPARDAVRRLTEGCW